MDAAGPRRRPDVHLPCPGCPGRPRPGEAVLVEFGRRQALGIVLAEAGDTVAEAGLGLDGGPVPADAPGLKPIVERVRADGPLLPPLTLALAARSRPTTWRRRRSCSGPCCRPACSSGSSWWPRSCPARRRSSVVRRRRRTRSTPSSPISSVSSRRVRSRCATWPGRTGGPACSAACARSTRTAGSASNGRCSAPGPDPATNGGSA